VFPYKEEGLMPTMIRNYFQDFGLLFKLPREFWTVQALNFVYCAFYFTFITFSSVHLSQDMGFSDVGAGLLFGVFMFGTAIIMILMGPVLDRLGFRKTPLIAAFIIIVGTVCVGLIPIYVGATPEGRTLMVIAYIISMIGNGLMFPVLTAGVKRFTNSETRGAGFNMWYLTMNIGAITMFMIDVLRRPLENNATTEQIAVFRDAGGNANIMWYLATLLVLCWLIVFSFLKNEEQFPEFKDIKKHDANALAKKKLVKKQPLGELLREIWQDRTFRKVLALLFITIPAHMPFVAAFIIYPKYYTRVISSDVEFGSIASLNPIIIVIGLILFAPLLKRFSVYWVLTVGMSIGGMSVLVLAIPPQWFQSVFGIGIADIGQAYMTMAIIQIVIFAMGEFIWSPQLQAYVGSIAPEGKEGTYMGVTRYPYTVAKLLGGAVGGLLLAKYCPEGVKPMIESGTLSYGDSPQMMMLILAMFTLVSPITLILLKKVFYVDTRAAAANE
jgi:proton-dependent oligopeptide transporter, POT family